MTDIDDVALYVIDGVITAVHPDATPYSAHTLVVRRPGASLTVRAQTRAHVFMFGGPRLEGQVSLSLIHI